MTTNNNTKPATAQVSPHHSIDSSGKAPSHLTATLRIHLAAKSVNEVSPGLFAIEIPAELISNEHSKFLQEIFPNLLEKAHEALYDLLCKEALISAVVSVK